jgi:glutamate dehydrogenase/leucine dehydrogenase
MNYHSNWRISYFEWVQDFFSFFWSEDDINARLTRIMRDAFAAVWQVAREKKCRCGLLRSWWRAPVCCRCARCAACIHKL